MEYETYVTHVDGEDKGNVFMFTLSTCIWCRKTKALLNELGVNYSFVDVDLVGEEAAQAVMDDMHKYNPQTSFPTFVYNDGEEVILGFEEDKIRETLK